MPLGSKPYFIGYVKELQGVFASAAFCAYNWSLLVFFWDFPSLILRWDAGEVVAYLAYQFMFALFETLIVTVFVAALGLLLPAAFLKQDIRTSGTALVLAFALSSLLFKERLSLSDWIARILPLNALRAAQIVTTGWAASLILLPILLVMIAKNEKVRRFINGFVENLSILTILYGGLTLFGLLLVVFRNLN